jgi:hypothetical protein
MQFKHCFKCLLELPLSAFYKHGRMSDRHLNKCKECTKKDVRATRLAKLDYYRSYDRSRASQPHRVAARVEYQSTDRARLSMAKSRKEYERRNAHKKRATTAVGNAIRDGRMEREPCFVCGESAEAHHAAYDLPMHVTWLCDKHHKQVHKEHREILRRTAA